MITDKIKELNKTREKIQKLEQSVAAELNKELAALPAQYGFENVNAFIAAVSAAAGKRRGRKAGAGTSARTQPAGKRRKRMVITDEIREQVKKLVAEGKTGNEIVKATGISLPSVQNIKKALGLVQKRKK